MTGDLYVRPERLHKSHSSEIRKLGLGTMSAEIERKLPPDACSKGTNLLWCVGPRAS